MYCGRLNLAGYYKEGCGWKRGGESWWNGAKAARCMDLDPTQSDRGVSVGDKMEIRKDFETVEQRRETGPHED